MNIFEYFYYAMKGEESRRLGCKQMINNGTGDISYHEWNKKYSGGCFCGWRNKKRKVCSKCKGTGFN